MLELPFALLLAAEVFECQGITLVGKKKKLCVYQKTAQITRHNFGEEKRNRGGREVGRKEGMVSILVSGCHQGCKGIFNSLLVKPTTTNKQPTTYCCCSACLPH